MAEKYLGHEFEIHGGGTDLRFPHHENELAQSRSLGHRFAHVWMHNGMLELDEEKMSKSLGNVVTLRNVLDVWGREALLVFHLSGHWSKPVDFSDDVMQQATARADRFRDVFRGSHEPAPEGAWERFADALDDDFSTPAALAVMHEWRDHQLLRRALEIFGLGSLAEEEQAPADVVALAERRQEARATREFAEADRLRGEIEAAGWDVRDEADTFRLVRRR
jgi:cysteinyl-tRNA synthetase